MWGSSHAEFLTKFFIIDSGQVWPVTAARYSPAQTCTGLGTPLAIPDNTNFDTFFFRLLSHYFCIRKYTTEQSPTFSRMTEIPVITIS